MKLVHLSDLHLGKRFGEYSLVGDQRYILQQISGLIAEEKPDAVLIAGDVYDKSIPTAEAVRLFDDFLVRLSALCAHVFVISGNHDSPERIAFASRIMDARGVHFSPVYDGMLHPVTLRDEYGEADIFMLPFIKPVHVRRFIEAGVLHEAPAESYTDAVKAALSAAELKADRRNILITHQFVTGALRSESEEISVGGSDNVDASVFADFDYVALGHIHSPQSCGAENIRYCGTPLKYSFSEARDKKSVTVVELTEKGNVTVRTLPLTPLHDMVELRGSYDELVSRPFYEGTSWQEDYVHITLTDEDDIPDAAAMLRTVYHGLMKLDYDNLRTRSSSLIESVDNAERISHIDLFAEFFELQNNGPMSDTQREYMEKLIESIWEAER